MLLNLFQGFCMALADSVPGVSGGTVALILGFYESFIGALHSLFGRQSTSRKKAFLYLCKLGIGWGLGMVLSILLLSRLFEEQIYVLSSLFLGLTIASIPFIIREERQTLRNGLRCLPFVLLGFLLVCGLTVFRGNTAQHGALHYLQLSLPQYGYLWISGVVAISAMVLPGVSGSTLLLIMGVYLPTIDAVGHLFRLDFAVLPGLASLAFGIVVGIALSAHIVRAALRKYRSQMLYLILGLLLGSLVAIVNGPTTLSEPQPPLSPATFELWGFLLGVGILIGLELLKNVTCKHTGHHT